MLQIKKEKIVKLLKQNNVPYLTLWGKKGLRNLLSELKKYKVTLRKNNNSVLKTTYLSGIHIFYEKGNKRYILGKNDQIFEDGQVNASVLEKVRKTEHPLKAAQRALRKLNLFKKIKLRLKRIIRKSPKESISYPGIFSKYVTYFFEIYLPEELYNPNGYTNKEKTSHLKWHPVL